MIKVGYFEESPKLLEVESFLREHFEVNFIKSKLDLEKISKHDWLSKEDPFADLDLVFLSPEFSLKILGHFPRIPEEMREAGYADFLIRQNGRMWPRNFLYPELRREIVQTNSQLNTHAVAYLAGAIWDLKFFVSVAAGLGFKKMILVPIIKDIEILNLIASSETKSASLNSFEKEETKYLEQGEFLENFFLEINRMYLGTEIKIMSETEITLQPNNGSILIAKVHPEKDEEILQNIVYLNFLGKDSLIVDLFYTTHESVLIDEAKTVGISTIFGRDVFLKSFYSVLKILLPNFLNREAYIERVNQYLNQNQRTTSRS